MKTYKICPRCNGTGRYDRGTCFRCHGAALLTTTRRSNDTYAIQGTEIATGNEKVVGIYVQCKYPDTALRAAKVAHRRAKNPRYHEETMEAVKL